MLRHSRSQTMVDTVELGSLPPLGTLPRRMHASLIRRERYGEPKDAFAMEEVDLPSIGDRDVLVAVMAAGINFNNVWAALGRPIDLIATRAKNGHPFDFHIGGSDASGIVWATGKDVRNVSVGDEVILSCCTWDPDAEDIQAGADPVTSTTARIWGYENNFGSFAQFTVVSDFQCFPKPQRLSWEEAAAYMLVGATAYRQLTGWPPHTIQPGDPVLIWGGAGGLGTMAIQIARVLGGRPIAVVSDDSKIDHCLRHGAIGVINRTEYGHWGRLPDLADEAAFKEWLTGVRQFGKKFWELLGERRNPRIVFEHVGEATIPTSIYLCDNAGMVVICGGTSGYAADVDLRYLWMRQKRFQGSHFANTEQCAALNQMVADGKVDAGLSHVGKLEEVGMLHQWMLENQHPPGNMAVLVGAPEPGMREAPW